jgi:hypothetical protein
VGTGSPVGGEGRDDEHRELSRFLLTGSANVLMLLKVADALPGRMEFVELWPFFQGEIDNRPESFVDAVFEPVLPAVVVTRVARGELFDRVGTGRWISGVVAASGGPAIGLVRVLPDRCGRA